MIILLSLTCLIAIGYGTLILLFCRGWKRIPEYRPHAPLVSYRISVIIAVRNEAASLPFLLDDLVRQTLSKEWFEVIIVDDHSEDDSASVAAQYCREYPWIRLLSLGEESYGKKQAIRTGVHSSTADIIVSTDGDSRVGPGWLAAILSYHTDHHPILLSGPVMFAKGRGLLHSWMQLEFLSLVLSGAGSFGAKMPVMCNGANLSFLREAYLSLNDPSSVAIPSGDDVMLMLRLKKSNPSLLRFLKSREAMVLTEPPSTLVEFLLQRIRWSSKTTKIHDPALLATAYGVWFMNASILISFFLFLININYGLIFITLYLYKLIIDCILLIPGLRWVGEKKLLWHMPVLQMIYPLYITLLPVVAITGKFKWKGRQYH